MNPRLHFSWNRLVAAARRAPAVAEDVAVHAAPAGFATRVVALAGVRPDTGGLFGAGFERMATRALGLAGACALAFAVWGVLPATAEARSTDASTSAADAYLDPVGEYLAVVQSSS